MSMFAPEFSQFWMTGNAAAREDLLVEARDSEASTQQAALEELAERVTAARSVA